MGANFTPSEAALDAGVAAWFGVTKVEAEQNFIRSRMRAAVLAVLEHEQPRDLVEAAVRLERRGFFAPSSCADAATAADMAHMRAAIADAQMGRPA